jgi:hypothetical protein
MAFVIDSGALRIFVLGSFRDFERARRSSVELLERLVHDLRELGWDAFLSGDRRSQELAGGNLKPWPMTERLEALCDLLVFVVTPQGREGGWSTELATLQAKRPEGAGRRLVMVPEGHHLSQVQDPEHGGILGDPPVLISRWSDEEELLNHVSSSATFLARWGRLPTPLRYRP